jgi:hypothetical protein
MILVLYRDEIATIVAALPPDSTVAIHFRHILTTMEKRELQAVAVVEHG